MLGSTETLVWVKDTNGKEYACFADDLGEQDSTSDVVMYAEQLTRCMDISLLLGFRPY